MASAAPTVPARWPHRRVLLAVLVVSLVLNLCFVAGVAWTRWRAPPSGGFEAAFQRMPSELALDDKQRAAFDRYVAAIRGRTENMRQQVAPLYAAAWEEMAKPQADPAEVKRLFDEVGVKRQASQRESVGQTLRRNFVTLMRQRWSSRRTR